MSALLASSDPGHWMADQVRVLQRSMLDCTSPLPDLATNPFTGSKLSQNKPLNYQINYVELPC